MDIWVKLEYIHESRHPFCDADPVHHIDLGASFMLHRLYFSSDLLSVTAVKRFVKWFDSLSVLHTVELQIGLRGDCRDCRVKVLKDHHGLTGW